MPSHGSLQQAVKVRPGRGETERRGKEKRKTLSGIVELFLLQVEKRFPLYLGNKTDLYSSFVSRSILSLLTKSCTDAKCAQQR